MKNFRMFFLAAMMIALTACGSKTQEPQVAEEVQESVSEIREDWSVSTVTGTITEIVAETRQITLMGTEGNLLTITAGEAVERFDEIVVGDKITFEYVVYVMAEFREPTAEEKATPLVVVAEAAKAPENLAPAGAIGALVKGIVTIEALNRPFMLATVKGPQGNYLTLPMKDAAFMEKLHIGQVLILTYAEATTVSLTKL